MSIYDSPRLAAGYAYGRPPVHGCIIQEIEMYLGMTSRVGRALDVGCGAGLSTAVLQPLAETVLGLEPVAAMLAHSRVVAPHALFLVGQAERLPFPAGTFDLVTAAGSLEMEVAVGMTLSSYLQCAMTETNVELAISRGVPEPEILAWCRRTLEGIFGDDSREVICDAYVACVKRATP